MTGLADAIGAATPTHGPKCGVAIILAQLDSEDRATLETALSNPTIQHTQITRALGAAPWNLRIGAGSVARHRAKVCSCDRS